MRYNYPYFVRNIRDLLQWFDEEKEEKTGKGLSSSQFPILGGRIKRFLNDNNLTVDQFKTILWGVMNENEKVYSPAYAFHFIEDFEKYNELRKQYEEMKEKKKEEVSFNSEDIINEGNEEELEEGFFDEL